MTVAGGAATHIGATVQMNCGVRSGYLDWVAAVSTRPRYPAFTFTYVPGASPSTLSLPSPGVRAGTFLPEIFESH